MATARRYTEPTHTGIMRRAGQSRGYEVKLTKTKEHWATPQGTLFRDNDGCPRGQKATAIWKLDLTTIKEIKK